MDRKLICVMSQVFPKLGRIEFSQGCPSIASPFLMADDASIVKRGETCYFCWFSVVLVAPSGYCGDWRTMGFW